MDIPIVKCAKFAFCFLMIVGMSVGGAGIVEAEEAQVSDISPEQMSALRTRVFNLQPRPAERKKMRASDNPGTPVEAVQTLPESELPAPSLRSLIQSGERPVNTELRLLLRVWVGIALQHSPEVRVANANETAASYDIDEVKGRRWPQVRLGLNSALSGAERSSGDTSGSVNVTTNVWDWGKNSAELHTAKAARSSAEQTGLAEREQVAFDTSSEVVNLMRFERSMTVVEDYVQQMSSRVDMLSKITQSDKGRASELVQARAKLLSALASRSQLENQLKVVQIKLRRLLGEEVPAVPQRLGVVGSPMIDTSVALAALDKHPLLLRLKEQAEMEEGRAQALKADGLPGLNLVAHKDQSGLSGSNDSSRNRDWYVGLDVQWQAFSGGSNEAGRRAADARKNAALEQYEKTDQDLRQEIRRLAQSRESAAQLANEYQRLSLETDRVRKMFYEQWYNLGKRTLLDVLVAENDHFNSQLQAINSSCDSLIADLSILSSSALLIDYLSL